MKRGTYHTGYRARGSAAPAPAVPVPVPVPAAVPGYQPAGTNGYGFASIFDQQSGQNFALETSNINPADDGNPLNSSFGFEPADLTLGPLNQAPTYGTAFPVAQSGDGSANTAIPGASTYKPRSPKRVAQDAALAAAGAATPASSVRYRARAAASGWASLSSTTKIVAIGGGVALIAAYLAYRRVTAPFRYAHRIGRAVKGVHKAVTGG